VGEEGVKKGGGGKIKTLGIRLVLNDTSYMFLLLISGCSFNLLEITESNKVTTTIVIV